MDEKTSLAVDRLVTRLMAPRHDNMTKNVAVQDNALVRSAYQMTLLEKRLLMLAISKVNHHSAPTRLQPIQVVVTREEWAELYSNSNPWRDLNAAADRLMGRVVIIHPTEKRGVRKKLNWTDSCEYHDSHVVIRFGYSLSLELAGMIDEFTKADLLDVAKLDSFYAVRLLELLKQYTRKGWLTITVDEFRIVMGAEKKYPQFYQFNQRVIKPAFVSIQQKIPELNVKLEYVKRKGSRAVTSLKFTFKRSEQRDMFNNIEGDADW
ncbi:MAG: replication initiation protein [Oceanospirillales bacterium]|nr:replication initiation protein [Oceanospirillales bacterium]